MRQPADSTGKSIQVGDKVRFRGQVYTIKHINEALSPPMPISFVEEQHVDEIATEFSVDLVEDDDLGSKWSVEDGE